MPAQDIVTVGASAGGVEALSRFVEGLPARLPAAVFVVLHMPSGGTSLLPAILDRAGPLPATVGVDGKEIRHGHIYVCPPDHHLLIRPGHMVLSRGPKENGHRPAIDPLFRSAAETYGPRVAGVVLSGTLDDGMLGSLDIKMLDGVTVAQDPHDAVFSSMPQSVIENVGPDYILPASDIGPLIARLAQGNQDRGAQDVLHEEHELEIAQTEVETPTSAVREGTPSVYSCPDCGGTLWEIEHSGVLSFRCRVGHAFSAETMAQRQSETLDAALWTALRALDEKIALSRRLYKRAASRGQKLAEERFSRQAQQAEHSAEKLRELLAAGETIVAPPPVREPAEGLGS